MRIHHSRPRPRHLSLVRRAASQARSATTTARCISDLERSYAQNEDINGNFLHDCYLKHCRAELAREKGPAQ